MYRATGVGQTLTLLAWGSTGAARYELRIQVRETLLACPFGLPSFFGCPARRAFLVCNGAIAWEGNESDPFAIFDALK